MKQPSLLGWWGCCLAATADGRQGPFVAKCFVMQNCRSDIMHVCSGAQVPTRRGWQHRNDRNNDHTGHTIQHQQHNKIKAIHAGVALR
jgi:hypothetical protein